MSSGKPKCFAQQFMGIKSDLYPINDVSSDNQWQSDNSQDSDTSADGNEKKPKLLKPNCKVTIAPENLADYHGNTKERPIKLIFSNCVPHKKKSRPKKSSKQVNGSEPKKRKKQRKANAVQAVVEDENIVYDPRWSTQLPSEILLAIFKLVVKTEGVAPFLPRASRVCRLWNDVANDASLWLKADLSVDCIRRTEEHLKWLCCNRLTESKEVNFNGWGKVLSGYGVHAIAANCVNLSAIHLSRCSKLTNECIKMLVDSSPQLSSFDLSAITECSGSSQTSPVSTATLTYIIEKCQSNLKELYLASNYLNSPNITVAELHTKCPNLTVLDLSNILPEGRTVTINLEKLQSGCSKLQVLRLANTIVQLTQASLQEQNVAPGFPDLEELSIAVCKSSSWVGFDESSLERIVKNSQKLRLLDVRGCTHTASTLVRIPAWDIDHLFLSRCELTKRQGLELVIQKWCHSLVVLDLSWNTCPVETIDQAVMALASVDSHKSPLQVLDLHGSSVSFPPIRALLKNCLRLRCIDLSSCRGMPRGIKRLYPTKSDIDGLRRDILDTESKGDAT